MSCPPTLARLADLKNRVEGLKREAETAVSNVRCILARGNAVVSSQEAIQNTEDFLKCYPKAGAELDEFMNNLVRLNCELEISLSKKSEVCETNIRVMDSISMCNGNQLYSPDLKERRSVSTNTDVGSVIGIKENSVHYITTIYDIEVDSILEMKHLLGDGPSGFWLSYYSDSSFHCHILELQKKITKGEIERLRMTPDIGQLLIGSQGNVFRGSVLSVSKGMICAIDIDNGSVKYLKEHDAWGVEDELGVPPQALYCKLWNIPDNIEWCDILRNIFSKFISRCNLVVTVKEIIPGIVPTFVVDVDAHDSPVLDFNVSAWICDHVVPECEKVNSFSLTGGNEKYLLHNLDPYLIYKEDSSDCNSVQYENITIGEANANVMSENLGSCENIVTNKKCEYDSFPVCSENVNDVISMKNDISDDTEISIDFVGKGNSGDFQNSAGSEISACISCREELEVEESLHHRKQNKTFTIPCALQKGTVKEMIFVRGNNPWDFILNCVSENEMDVLQTKLTQVGESNLLTPFVVAPGVGDFAIAKCNTEYCRVRIIDGSENAGGIFVVDVDSGEFKVVHAKNLWVLEEEFSLFSAGAIKCSLWNITRNRPYWNTDLEQLFRKVMTKGLLKVHVKDVCFESLAWKHIVDVTVLADYTFNVSEWTMLFVVPKLEDIKKCTVNGYDGAEIYAVLDPEKLYGMECYDAHSIRRLGVNQKRLGALPKKLHGVNEKDQTEGLNLAFQDSNVITHVAGKQRTEDNIFSLREINELDNHKETVAELRSDKNSKGRVLGFKKASYVVEPGTKYFAFLSIIVSPSEFYVHIISDENTVIDEMHEALKHYYSFEGIDYKTKSDVKQLVAQCCAVFYSGQWCRAHILDWFDDSSEDVLVYIVDYGVQTRVSFQLVQHLRSDFLEYPVFAQRCTLAQIVPPNNGREWPERSLVGFRSLLNINAVYEICIEQLIESLDTLSVFLSSEHLEIGSINDCLVNEGYAIPQINNEEAGEHKNFHSIVCPIYDSRMDEILLEDEDWYYDTKNQSDLNYFDNNTAGLPEVDEELTVIVTVIVNIRSFYAVLTTPRNFKTTTNDILMRMNKRIKSAVQSGLLGPSKYLTCGSIVVARYNEDGEWYRARLLSPVDDNGTADVFFVDYGNTDCVHKDYFREIQKEFCSFPFQAIRFFIDDIDMTAMDDENAQRKAIDILYELEGKSDVSVKVVRRQNEDILVNIFYKGENIGAKMCNIYKQSQKK